MSSLSDEDRKRIQESVRRAMGGTGEVVSIDSKVLAVLAQLRPAKTGGMLNLTRQRDRLQRILALYQRRN